MIKSGEEQLVKIISEKDEIRRQIKSLEEKYGFGSIVVSWKEIINDSEFKKLTDLDKKTVSKYHSVIVSKL